MPGTQDHPIEVGPAGVQVRAEARGRTYLDSGHPVALTEEGYPTRYYVPAGDVAMGYLEKSETVTHCPFKGDAAWYHAITPNNGRIEDAVWVYESPPAELAAIKGHFSADPEKLDVIRETPDGEDIDR